MIFALAGNQNSGKTTLFNQLTGSNQHVGNFPGVTVDRKDGIIRNYSDSSVVDLPGIYSLSPYTSEEIVTRDFLLECHPNAIINIIDATNLERNLYLSLQLIELNIPMVIALNMMDEVRTNGGTIKISEFAKQIGVPCVPISASRNEGIEELIEVAMKVASNKTLPKRFDFCSGAIHRCIHAVAHLIEDHANNINVPPRFAATKLVEGDEPMLASLKLSDNEIDMIEHSVTEMEKEMSTDREAAMADMRYTFIENLCKETTVKCDESIEYLRSVKIDAILTHKYYAIPAFLGIMLLVFYFTFGLIGNNLSDLLSLILDNITSIVSNSLTYYGLNPVVHSLLIDGIFAGVSSVLSFLPIIVVLFFFLSILEDSGYMARVAFVMDKLLRKLGLSGRSFVPMLIGFGCSVPAIMATRTLSSERDRKMTILLTPFMSCSAKLPIYAMFTAAFFPNYGAFIMILLYVLGMFVGILCALVMKSTIYRGEPVPFVMELPNYRLPSSKSVLHLMWEKAKDFLMKAFTIIFLASVVIWFLQSFDLRLNYVNDSSISILANIGKLISPLFAPLGFNDWRASTALITGLTAKEAVVSTFTVLLSTSTATLPVALQSIFTPVSAFSFLTFTLLYTPCIAAIAAVRRELGSVRNTILMVIAQCGVAWLIAFIIYVIGSMVF